MIDDNERLAQMTHDDLPGTLRRSVQVEQSAAKQAAASQRLAADLDCSQSHASKIIAECLSETTPQIDFTIKGHNGQVWYEDFVNALALLCQNAYRAGQQPKAEYTLLVPKYQERRIVSRQAVEIPYTGSFNACDDSDRCAFDETHNFRLTGRVECAAGWACTFSVWE